MITRKRSVIAVALILLMLMICTVSVHAMYAPASSSNVKNLINNTFTKSKEKGGANGKKSTPVKTTTQEMYAIKPIAEKYQYMIRPSQITKKSSRIVSGTTLKDEYMNEVANHGKRKFGKWTDSNFCFNLDSKEKPKVEYTGYEIYDAQKHAYVQLKVIGEGILFLGLQVFLLDFDFDHLFTFRWSEL